MELSQMEPLPIVLVAINQRTVGFFIATFSLILSISSTDARF